jgi:hypothetical protein
MGKFDDTNKVVLDLAAADFATAPANVLSPTEAEIKTHVDTLTDATDAALPFDNNAIIRYAQVAGEPWLAIFDKVADVYTRIEYVSPFPTVVADVTELKAIPAPTDGLTVQILSALPRVVKYVFNATAATGNAATDGTTGFWNSESEDDFHIINNIATATATATSEDGANTAGKCLDSDVTTGWASTGEANPELSFTATSAFRPGVYSFSQSSSQDGGAFADAADITPYDWTLQGSQDGGTNWDVLDTQTGVTIPQDGGDAVYKLADVTHDYADYKIVFTVDAAKAVVLTEVKIGQAVSNDSVSVVTYNEADL